MEIREEEKGNSDSQSQIYLALRALMSEKPFGKITVTDVASRAGTSRMTFYRHYRSTKDVLLFHSERTLKAISDDILNGNISDAFEFWEKLYTEIECSELIMTMQSAGLLEEFFGLFEKLFIDIYVKVLGKDLSVLNNRLHMEFSMGGLISLLRYASVSGTSISRSEILSFLKSLLENRMKYSII